MLQQNKDTLFKDIPLGFSAHPVTGNVKAVTNREAVKQSVKLIVLTNFFERPYNPYLGGHILSQLFENVDSMTEFNITKNIKQALDNFEPRAIVDEVRTQANPEGNSISATITFRIKNDPDPISVDVLLERIR